MTRFIIFLRPFLGYVITEIESLLKIEEENRQAEEKARAEAEKREAEARKLEEERLKAEAQHMDAESIEEESIIDSSDNESEMDEIDEDDYDEYDEDEFEEDEYYYKQPDDYYYSDFQESIEETIERVSINNNDGFSFCNLLLLYCVSVSLSEIIAVSVRIFRNLQNLCERSVLIHCESRLCGVVYVSQ